MQLALAFRYLGRSREMADAYREAIALYQFLADEHPNEEGPLLDAVHARRSLASVLDSKMQMDESLSLLEKNRSQLEAYLAAGCESVEVRLGLVETMRSLGHCYQARGDPEAAVCCWRAGCQQGVGLEIAAPNDPRAWEYPTECALGLPRGDPAALTPAQAILRLEKAVQLLEIYFARDPEHTREWLADVGRRLAVCYLDVGRHEAAFRMECRAAEALSTRADEIPLLELMRLEWSALIARRERQVGQFEAARHHAQEIADGFEAFCRTHAADPALLNAAVDFLPRLAAPLRHAESADQSRRVVECALQILGQKSAANADAAQLRRLSELRTQLAKCRMQDNHEGVEAALREAVDAARRLVAIQPEHRYLLDERLSRLARWLTELGRWPQAAACLHECECLWTGDANGLRSVAASYRNLAKEVKNARKALSDEERTECEKYLAEAQRLEKAADMLRR